MTRAFTRRARVIFNHFEYWLKSRQTRFSPKRPLNPAPHGCEEAAHDAAGLFLRRGLGRRQVADVVASRGCEAGKADEGRESRPAVRVGQAGQLTRTADANRA